MKNSCPVLPIHLPQDHDVPCPRPQLRPPEGVDHVGVALLELAVAGRQPARPLVPPAHQPAVAAARQQGRRLGTGILRLGFLNLDIDTFFQFHRNLVGQK